MTHKAHNLIQDSFADEAGVEVTKDVAGMFADVRKPASSKQCIGQALNAKWVWHKCVETLIPEPDVRASMKEIIDEA